MQDAGGLRRALAVFIDFCLFFAIWIASANLVLNYAALSTLVLFLLIDVVLTAFFGLSPGRYATGIRVVRTKDGGRPGLIAALVRVGLVLVSGWLGLFVYLLSLRYLDQTPRRMWWDAASRTRLVQVAPGTSSRAVRQN